MGDIVLGRVVIVVGLSEFRKFCKECSELIGRVGRGWDGGFEDANTPAMVSWVVFVHQVLSQKKMDPIFLDPLGPNVIIWAPEMFGPPWVHKFRTPLSI